MSWTVDYPYSSFYLTRDEVENSKVEIDVLNLSFSWPFDSRSKSTRFTGYYNSDGLPGWRRYVLSGTHWLGLDGIPQLIDEEYNFNGEALQLGAAQWKRYRRVSRDFNRVATGILDRGTYFSRTDPVPVAEGIDHRDKFIRDVGMNLSHYPDRDVQYNYVRNQLVLEAIRKDGGLPYLPLSILLSLSRHAEDSVCLFSGIEGVIHDSLFHFNRVTLGSRGVVLDGRVVIDRSGDTISWMRLAHRLSSPLLSSERTRGLVIMTDLRVDVSEVRRRVSPDQRVSLYIIARLPGKESDIPSSLVTEIEGLGLQYRGTQAFSVGKQFELRYPIWYFSSVPVETRFPIPARMQENRDAPNFVQLPEPPFLLPWSPSDTSIGRAKLGFIRDKSGIETWTGTRYPYLTSTAGSFQISRVGDERLFMQIPLFSTPNLESIVVTLPPASYHIHSIYRDDRRYTSIIVYEGSFAVGDVLAYVLPDGWLLSEYQGNWFIHSDTASLVTAETWSVLVDLQKTATASQLRRYAQSHQTILPLTFGALVRYWTRLRYNDLIEGNQEQTRWLMDGGLAGDHATHVSQIQALVQSHHNQTTSSLLARNQFGLLDVYQGIVAHPQSNPSMEYPLPVMTRDIHPAYLTLDRDGRKIRYDRDVGIDVLVLGNLVQFQSPLDDIESRITLPDGVYRLTLGTGTSQRLRWYGEGEVTSLLPATPSDLLDYYCNTLRPYRAEDTLFPPAAVTRHLYPSDTILVDSSTPFVAHGHVVVALRPGEESILVMSLSSSPPGMIEAYYLGDEARLARLTRGRVVMDWSSITSLPAETRYDTIRISDEQAARLGSSRLPDFNLAQERRVIATDQLFPGTITTWFESFGGETDLVADIVLEQHVHVYRRQSDRVADLSLDELDQPVPDPVKLASYSRNHVVILGQPTQQDIEELKRQLMRAMFSM